MYGIGIGLRSAIMARGPLWLPEGQYLDHTTTSNLINLFINWLLGHTITITTTFSIHGFLGLIVTPGFDKAIIGLARPLWILLGHYVSSIIGFASPFIQHRPIWPFSAITSTVK